MKKKVIGNCILYCGDMKEVIPHLIKNNAKVHSIVTDPPYHLQSIVKRFSKTSLDGETKTEKRGANRSDQYSRTAGGFMGMKWDGGDISFDPETWKLLSQVIFPGSYLLSFTGTRTYHRIAVAIEDAGFEIRDMVSWVYGQGFPKSHDLGNGWGTALKPAMEPIVFARIPIEKTNKHNMSKYGTGGINIDDCRIPLQSEGEDPRLGGEGTWSTEKMAKNVYEGGYKGTEVSSSTLGRWPANLIHDGSDEVIELFPYSTSGHVKDGTTQGFSTKGANIYGNSKGVITARQSSEGSAARFFYCPKTNKTEREEGLGSSSGERSNNHPTVKPTDLMAYLCRLVTKKDGIILDPFMGSGSTGKACVREGFRFIGIEQSEEYFDIACKRIEYELNRGKGNTSKEEK